MLHRQVKNVSHTHMHTYICSPQDTINPPEMAQRVKQLFGKNAYEYVHPRGHVVPQDDEAVQAYSKFLSW
jgi:hypothetical protein